MSANSSQILHVVVVGFHHKKGCQVEFSYPPLESESSSIPEEWANLPSLAMPDGAHNTDSDVIYFLLPSKDDPGKAIFGISCYRQIAADQLVSKDSDVTRSTVQKSVCVLSRVPLFGVLKAKLQLITQAYFNERDFAKVEVLSQMYNNLCEMFEGDLVDGQAASMDISVRELVRRYKHRTILLFKLLLLERKVVFNISPVQKLGDTMIALLSLFPRLLEDGLFYAATADTVDNEELEEGRECMEEGESAGDEKKEESTADKPGDNSDNQEVSAAVSEKVVPVVDSLPSPVSTGNGDDVPNGNLGREVIVPPSFCSPKDDSLAGYKDGYGFPLSIYVKDTLFHPYLSISYMDLIRSKSVRAYTIGATNQLFVQRKELIDAIVTVDDSDHGHVEVTNVELRKVLTLTTADLRFGDYLLKNVEMNESVEAAWEGGDEWIRLQFRAYLLSMAASSRSDLQISIADHGVSFVNEWRATRNYNIWMRGDHPDLASAAPGHAFSGQMGVRDVALMVEHAVAGSEGAKKALTAISQTGRNLGETGSRVKQSFTSWLRGAASAVGSAAGSLQGVAAGGSNNAAADAAEVAEAKTEEKIATSGVYVAKEAAET